MPTQKEDIAKLKTDVSLIKQGQKFTNSTVKRIETAISKMAFVDKEEYIKDQLLVNKRLDDLEQTNKDNAPNRYFNSEARKFILMGIGIVISALIGYFLTKVGIK